MVPCYQFLKKMIGFLVLQKHAMAQEFTVLKGLPQEPCYLLQFDGLSIPNPGEATSGAVLFSPTGEIVFETGEYMANGTNNTAEYTGLLIGVRLALEKGVRNIRIEGDSMLVIKQVLGQWKVANVALSELHAKILVCLEKFDYVALRHVLRDKNSHADRITNDVFKSKTSFVRCEGFHTVAALAKEPTESSEMLTILKDIQTKLGLLLEKLQ